MLEKGQLKSEKGVQRREKGTYKATMPLANESTAKSKQSFQIIDRVGADNSGTKMHTILLAVTIHGTFDSELASSNGNMGSVSCCLSGRRALASEASLNFRATASLTNPISAYMPA